MRRSHPPTLLTLAERAVSQELALAPGDVVLAAVSGGPDSMALLHVLAKLVPRRRAYLVAHGVDHGLREAAADELATAARLSAELGVPFATTRVHVPPGGNLMARARAARYAALRAAVAQATHPDPALAGGRRFIATGHHADDRAETALIRLLRGSGPTGLAVLPAQSGDLLRPFIRARRSDIEAHLVRHRVPSSADPTNIDPRYLRSRVRHEVLPLLTALSPNIVEHLCALADALGDQANATTSVAMGGALVPPGMDALELGRAQRVALRRAFQVGNTRARVALRGGQIAQVDLTGSKIVLTKGNK